MATAADFGRLLLLLLLVARAWVPVGYMPDADALRQGRLALGFCAAGGGSLPQFNREGGQNASLHAGEHAGTHAGAEVSPHSTSDPGPHDGLHAGLHAGLHGASSHASPHANHSEHHQETGAGQECPFGLSAHQVLQVPPVPALAPVLLRWLAQTPPQADHPHPPMPAAGPPLGQRAPPLLVE